jgi:hypothetical protein
MTMEFGAIMAMGSTAITAAALPFGFIVLGYLFVLLDKREDRPSKDDKQVGSKLVLWLLILTGAGLALFGVQSLLAFILGGFKGGGAAVKGALVPVVGGAAPAAAFALMFLPRTNNSTQPQVERFAMGAFASLTGIGTVVAFYLLIDSVVFSRGWHTMSGMLSILVVTGGAAFVSLFRHGQLSGWTQAARPAAPIAPAGGGYPGGYPQQGGGYPPQGGGGYPPQGGGGYPPQGGGGYPPQGGGGYPPQGGGGYPPQGGGYGR